MSTTLLFVELLIAGIQVVVWLVLLVLSVFGFQWLSSIPRQLISEWQTLIAVLILSFVYVLGILIDRLGDLLFSKWDRKIAVRQFPNAPFAFGVLRFQLNVENVYLHQQLEYTRSRLRIARDSALNFALTTIFAEIFVIRWVPGSSRDPGLILFIALAGVMITLLAVYTWYRLSRNYVGLIRYNYQSRPDRLDKRQRKLGNKR